METLGNQNQPDSSFKYYCLGCDYGTNKKCNYNTHIISAKHYKNTNCKQNQLKISAKTQYTCNDCCKYFKNRSGLWKHKKKCNILANKNDTDKKEEMINDKELIQYLLKENSEFKQLMIEQNKIISIISKNVSHCDIINETNK
jgi:hypothetical protein